MRSSLANSLLDVVLQVLFDFCNDLHHIFDFCFQIYILQLSCLNKGLILCLLDVLSELVVNSKQLLLVSLCA